MKFRQHIPNMVDTGDKPFEIEFNTLEELLDNDFIKGFKQHPFDKGLSNEYFKQYSISHHHDDNYLLMVEYLEHPNFPEWWVLVYLSGAGVDKLELPTLEY